MRLIQKLLFAVAGLGFSAVVASASPTAPVKDVDYQVLPEPVATETGRKVEVLEFFSYSCPHCFRFDPLLAVWVKKNADKIAFKRIHVGGRPGEMQQQRAYLTMEAMGITEKYHAKIFAAIHEEHQHLVTDEALFDWAAKNGIDRAAFIAVYRSFGMQAKVNRSQDLLRTYRVPYWPLVAIDGRFITSPSLAGAGIPPPQSEEDQQKAALQVMDYLLLKAKADRK